MLHRVQEFPLGSKQTWNDSSVSFSRNSGGSPGGCEHTRVVQVASHSDGVDELVHDANCDGQLLATWQLVAVFTTASRIASGSLVSAALSISGVGVIIASLMYGGVFSVTESVVAVAEARLTGSWLAVVHAQRPHTTVMTAAGTRMITMPSLAGMLTGDAS